MNKKQVPYSKLRGVDLLLGNSTDNDSSAELDINLIVKPPSQPRRYFDRTALEQLKSSIEQHGILESDRTVGWSTGCAVKGTTRDSNGNRSVPDNTAEVVNS
jgi:hypothetical protein